MPNTGKSNPGNFANDRDKASQAGKKGGQQSSVTNKDKASEQRKGTPPGAGQK